MTTTEDTAGQTAKEAPAKAAPAKAHADAPVSAARVKAYPAVITKSGQTGTTVEVRSSDFRSNGIEHDTVTFDFRVNDCSLPVGDGGLSKEAADFLTKNYPDSFKYVK